MAEDDSELRGLLCQTLADAGHLVSVASDGQEACRRMKQDVFDLLVTDVLMPERDGLEVITQFRLSFPQAKVLAISGGGARFGMGLCLELAHRFGADEVLTKPFTLGDLVQAVDRVRRAAGSVKN